MKSLHRGFAAALLFVLCVTGLYATPALAGTAVRTCDWCNNWNDIQSSASWWVANDGTIAANQYFVTASAAPWYSVQGCFKKQFMARLGYRAVAQSSMSPCPSPNYPLPPPVVNDPQFLQSRYYIRVGDINGDTKLDLFVTGQSDRYVQDFFLVQQNPSSFTVVSQPTFSQVTTANSWPVIGAPVYREDLNFDGLYDFYIEEVSNVVENAPNILVYTLRNVGTQAAKAVSDGQGFQAAQSAITYAINSGSAGLDYFYSQSCVDYYDPSLVLPFDPHDWLYDSSPDSWFREQYIYRYGGIYYSNGFAQVYETCYPNAVTEPYYTRNVYRAWGDYIGMNGFACASCAEHAGQIIAGDPKWRTVFNGTLTAGMVATAAWGLTGLLLADDVSVVGIADDVLVPFSFLVGVGASVVVVLNENANSPDRGPTSPPPIFGQSTPGDPFQMPPGFDPKNTSNQDRPGNSVGNSTRLGRNMERAGWARPHPDAQAHHIVQGGSEDAAAVEMRALLQDYGIDIDEAANGVWLPRTQSSAETAARAHLSRGMHTKTYRDAVRDRLRDAVARAEPGQGGNAIRTELQEIAKLLLRNQQFW